MNLFNRIFTLVSIVVLAILGLAGLLIPLSVLSFTSSVLNASEATQLGFRIVTALAVLAIVIFLLWLEFRRTSSRTVEVSRASGGSIRITTQDIEDRIKQQVDAISGVINVRAHANERDNAVVARLDVQATSGTDLIAKGEEIAAITRVVVQDELGLKMYGKPQITIQAVKTRQIQSTPVPAASDSMTDHTADSTANSTADNTTDRITDDTTTATKE